MKNHKIIKLCFINCSKNIYTIKNDMSEIELPDDVITKKGFVPRERDMTSLTAA